MWTKVTKPVSSGWTPVNPAGRTQYDQADTTYDSATMYYDGVNPNAWTNLSKPSRPTTYVGIASGLLIPLTFRSGIPGDSWTKVSKAT